MTLGYKYMETVAFIIAIYGGIWLLGWFFGKLGEWNDERKRSIRNKVADQILPHTNITNVLIEDYKDKLKAIGYQKNNEFSEFWRDVMSNGRKSYRNLVGKCPSCSVGELRVMNGKYGKFLGCSAFPNCKYTKNLDKAMSDYKDKSYKDFFEMFNQAYQK